MKLKMDFGISRAIKELRPILMAKSWIPYIRFVALVVLMIEAYWFFRQPH